MKKIILTAIGICVALAAIIAIYRFAFRKSIPAGADMHRFKVPNLRNISKTAPYFHDGTQLTLEDAVRGMFHFELGKQPSDAQVSSIATFLKALNGESPYFEK